MRRDLDPSTNPADDVGQPGVLDATVGDIDRGPIIPGSVRPFVDRRRQSAPHLQQGGRRQPTSQRRRQSTPCFPGDRKIATGDSHVDATVIGRRRHDPASDDVAGPGRLQRFDLPSRLSQREFFAPELQGRLVTRRPSAAARRFGVLIDPQVPHVDPRNAGPGGRWWPQPFQNRPPRGVDPTVDGRPVDQNSRGFQGETPGQDLFPVHGGLDHQPVDSDPRLAGPIADGQVPKFQADAGQVSAAADRHREVVVMTDQRAVEVPSGRLADRCRPEVFDHQKRRGDQQRSGQPPARVAASRSFGVGRRHDPTTVRLRRSATKVRSRFRGLATA